MKNPKKYFEKNGIIYGDSYKYEFGKYHHCIYEFKNWKAAEEWLKTEQYEFRTRELISKTEYKKLNKF